MKLRSPFLCLLTPIMVIAAGVAETPKSPTLSVDVDAEVHRIDPNIYGIQQGGLDPAFAKEIELPNTRWGGDNTTRYNWQVDSSNTGADFYFVGGDGQSTATPSGQVDTIIENFRPAHTSTLVTIPIIPYINSTSEYTCSFPESVYGPQQSYNPFVTVAGGDQCGNGVLANGDYLVDTNIYYNNIDNTPGLQEAWIDHMVSKFGEGKTGAKYFQLDNEPSGWGNTHRDLEPNGVIYDDIIDLGQKYAAMIKKATKNSQVLGPSDFTLGGWIGDTNQQNGLYARSTICRPWPSMKGRMAFD